MIYCADLFRECPRESNGKVKRAGWKPGLRKANTLAEFDDAHGLCGQRASEHNMLCPYEEIGRRGSAEGRRVEEGKRASPRAELRNDNGKSKMPR